MPEQSSLSVTQVRNWQPWKSNSILFIAVWLFFFIFVMGWLKGVSLFIKQMLLFIFLCFILSFCTVVSCQWVNQSISCVCLFRSWCVDKDAVKRRSSKSRGSRRGEGLPEWPAGNTVILLKRWTIFSFFLKLFFLNCTFFTLTSKLEAA